MVFMAVCINVDVGVWGEVWSVATSGSVCYTIKRLHDDVSRLLCHKQAFSGRHEPGLKFCHPFRAFVLVFCFAFALALPTLAEAPCTRASQLPGMATGMGKLLHSADYLRDYPGSQTAIFAYFKLDSMDIRPFLRDLRIQTATQSRMNRDFYPQIALETERLSLPAFTRELSRRGSPIDLKVRFMASEIARYRDQNKWFFIRPFSEMNDGTLTTPWEFGHPHCHNTPADFAAAWTLLRQIFDQEGASNALFMFSPLAAHGVHRENEVLDALNRIPVGQIDCFSMNLYSRPRSAYGGNGADPIPFADLAHQWMGVLSRSRHKGIPLAIAEMGISSQASDAQRAKWLQSAFQFGRSHRFVMMTYFNFPHRYWEIHARTQTGNVLNEELNREIANIGSTANGRVIR